MGTGVDSGEKMKKRLFIGTAILLVVAVIVIVTTVRDRESDEGGYKLGEVQVTTIQNLISSTGTLTPLEEIEVGTQVSGTVDEIYVDYNDEVKKGQLLAMIDYSTLDVAIREAEAKIMSAEADLEEAQFSFELNDSLYEKGFISQSELLSSRVAVKKAKANLITCEISLENAKLNRSYAEIYSPVDGVVLDRSVDEGQTVAASLSTPTLFTLAVDLSQMEILVDVDESDIGEIKTGQRVEFTVPAYIDRTYEGEVTQLRLQPEVASNVVTYTVVVLAENEDRSLLPGMTATVDFIVEEAENVLAVSSSALRLTPNESMLSAMHEQMEERRKNGSPRGKRAGESDTTNIVSTEGMPPRGAPPEGGPPPGMGSDNPDFGMIWILNDEGKPQPFPVKIGMSDGQLTEVSSPELVEGMQVITGFNGARSKTTSTESQQQRGGMGGRMGGGMPPPF